MVAAVGSGTSSWTALLDIERVGVEGNDSVAAALQLRRTIKGLIGAGHWRIGDADIIAVTDSLYAEAYLAHQLADLPVIVVSRVRSDRVFYAPAPDRVSSGAGRPAHHGAKMSLKEPTTWFDTAATVEQQHDAYGHLSVRSFDDLHQKLSRQSVVWAGHDGPLPVIGGTLIRLEPERLPHAANPGQVWLWASAVRLDTDLLTACFTAWLRRFDIEHTFRFLKQYLALTLPRLRSAEAADRWTALAGAAYMQLGMARGLVADRPFPWERRLEPDRLTPVRVKRGFRHLQATLPVLPSMPKTRQGGTGRISGSKNHAKAPVRHPGKYPRLNHMRTKSPQPALLP